VVVLEVVVVLEEDLGEEEVQEADLEVAVAWAEAWDLVSEAALEQAAVAASVEGVDLAKELVAVEA
jgi:hypothetical protein